MTANRSRGLWGWWLLLLALTAWAYWPGLYGPMLLDDAVNLRPLKQLELATEYATDVIAGNRSGLGRPVSMASFTLERLYLDRETFGQKQWGLLLHLLNGTLVLLLARSLLRAASQPYAGQCALLIAGLWLTMPLLLSTTLYIIQRMTLLSATFSLLAMLAYCRGRLAFPRQAIPWFLLSALCVMLAALSKENGVLAVPMIVMMEVFVFGFHDAKGKQQRGLWIAHGMLVAVPFMMLLYLLVASPEFLIGGYQIRDFTLEERLLTQPRVLLDYVGQMLWVDIHRLGLYHDDFPVSRSLSAPAGTGSALLFWVVVVSGVAVSAVARRGRLLAFGVAFFLVGHFMESTFFPLEMYFEHRNYLPAFGIVFALVAAGNQLQSRLPPLRVWLLLLAGLLLGRSLLALGSQAMVWSDVRTVAMEAANHHPESERALLGLAEVYALDGYVATALPLAQRANAIAGREGATAQVLDAIFYCLAGKELPDDLFSAGQLTRAQVAEPYFGDHVYQLARTVIDGRCSPESGRLVADTMASWLQIGDGADMGTTQIYGSLMLLENELERYENALAYAELMTGRRPDDVMGLQFTMYLAGVVGQLDKAEAAQQALLALRDQGKLNREQTANLEMFLGDADNNDQ